MKLKKCPHCGNEVLLHAMTGFDCLAYIIHCEECRIGTGFREDKEQCINDWNKRVDKNET